MSTSLISSLIDLTNSGVSSRMAIELGAAEGAIVRAFRAAFAAILTGIVNKAGNPGGLSEIFYLASQVPADSLKSTGTHEGDSDWHTEPLITNANRLLSIVFEDKQHALLGAISQHAGLSSNGVASVMAMAAPMVLGLVGKLVHEQGMLSSELADMLSREAEDLPSYLPTELAGLQERRQAAIRTSDLATTVVPWRGAGHGRSLAKFTVVALVLCGSWLLLRDGTRRATNSAMAGTADSVSRARTSAGELGHFIDHELPNNVRINIPENGMESKLLSYIQDPAQATGNEKWFDFDRLKFDARSAIPLPESEEQLNNIASILKAYPLVKLKIGGYTDNTGGRRASQRLSENRAEAVRRALTGMGVDSSRLDAKGYADQHPIADNATEEGRARNRRISLRVLSK